MFGGLTFMVADHMACGVAGDELMVRIRPEYYDQALARPHVREMTFTGRSLKGFVFVAPPGVAADDDLSEWIARAVAQPVPSPPVPVKPSFS